MCRLGAQNVSIGNRAGNGSSTVSNNTGQCNVFIGSYAGCKTRDGHSNIGIGAKAGFCISNGSINVFIGCYAGCAMTSCCGNVLIGGYGRCSSGADNIYLGTCAGRGSSTVGNNTGGHNVAIGYQAGLSITSGQIMFSLVNKQDTTIIVVGRMFLLVTLRDTSTILVRRMFFLVLDLDTVINLELIMFS